MTYLSEDPTLLAGGLLLLAGGLRVALRVNAAGQVPGPRHDCPGLAAAVVVVEWMWVTDNERIEQVVYGLRQAAVNSDVDGLLSHMAPDVRISEGGYVAGPRSDAGPDPGQPGQYPLRVHPDQQP